MYHQRTRQIEYATKVVAACSTKQIPAGCPVTGSVEPCICDFIPCPPSLVDTAVVSDIVASSSQATSFAVLPIFAIIVVVLAASPPVLDVVADAALVLVPCTVFAIGSSAVRA